MDIPFIGPGCNQIWSHEEIGSKAANLARMAALGLPVPPAFVVPIAMCARLNEPGADSGEAERQLAEALREGIAYLETATGKKFGDRRRPLLVSVRSGAAVSMPGMLDTVLDVGCTSAATRGLIRMTGNPGFAWDCRRRFLESYAETVLELEAAPFAVAIEAITSAAGAASERDLDAEDRERLALAQEASIANLNAEMPADAMSALVASAMGVCRSWTNEHARTYRKLQNLEHLQGTAVTVQAMVFGNRGRSSGSGVAFSRDPSNGNAAPVIDFLFEAQGEDVVSGRRTPQTELAIAQAMPAVMADLRDVLARLEKHFRDVQDVEFTIEDGKLWLLQTRAAKRTPRAALRFAVDFVREGLLTPEEAAQRLEGLDSAKLAINRFVGSGTAAGTGTGAAAGVAVGRAALELGRGKATGRARRSCHPGAPRYQHVRCRRIRDCRRHSHLGRRPHGPCSAGGASPRQTLRRGLPIVGGRRRSPSGAARRRNLLGRRLALDRWRQRRGFPRPAPGRERTARSGFGAARSLARRRASQAIGMTGQGVTRFS